MLWGDIAKSEIKQGVLMFAFEAGVGKIFKLGTKGNKQLIESGGMKKDNNGLTAFGSHWESHSSRKNGGGAARWGKVKGGVEEKNAQGYKTFQDIYSAPGKFKLKTSDSDVSNVFLEKMLPDGRGMRLERNGEFKGFIDKRN